MLSSTQRLKKKSDFDAVYRNGRAMFGPFLTVRFIGNQLKKSRFAIVVGKKVDKRAVVRNKIKRKIAASLAALLDEIKPGYDMVIVVRKDAVAQDQQKIKQAIAALLRKAKLLN